jgi:hypothetical protein
MKQLLTTAALTLWVTASHADWYSDFNSQLDMDSMAESLQDLQMDNDIRAMQQQRHTNALRFCRQFHMQKYFDCMRTFDN